MNYEISQLDSVQETEHRSDLVLASYKATSPVASLWDRGMETVFKSKQSGSVDFNIDYMDLINFNDENCKQLLRDNLRQAFSGGQNPVFQIGGLAKRGSGRQESAETRQEEMTRIQLTHCLHGKRTWCR